METKANFILIGAFTVFGFLGLLGFLMWFAKLELNRQFAYYDAYFHEVSGLSVSSQVLYAGLDAGKVVAIELAPINASAPVRVRLELNEDTPVRTDSRVSIDTSAVTGISTVLITPGSSTAPLLRDSSEDPVPVIPSSRSPLQTLGQEVPELMGRLNLMAAKLNELLNDENVGRVSSILANIDAASGNLNKTMDDLSRATDAVSAAATDFAGFGDRLGELSQSADKALTSFAGASDQAQQTLATIDTYVGGDLAALTSDLQKTSDELRTDLAQLRERAEISLGKLDTALDTASGTMAAGHAVLNDLGPVFGDFRTTLGGINTALANLPEDLPRIVSRIDAAAGDAAGAFQSLRGMIDNARGPVQTFTREGLPQYARLGQELRTLVNTMDQFFSKLKRDPAQLLRGQPTPEFRR